MNRETVDVEQSRVVNHGWRVTFAGLGISMALGILYTWSVISKGIPEAWGWNSTEEYLPYAVACLVFSIVMVPAGRMQDKFGPRLVASLGGVLVGVGMIVASIMGSLFGFVFGFGVLAGAGIGFGYASATPPAVKWFCAARTGLIAGIVVSGFGLASVYAAPLAQWLIGTVGLQNSMMILGIAFMVIVVGLAQLLTPPPKGYVPAGTPKAAATGGNGKKEDFSPMEMLSTVQFYMLWFMYACGAGAGLMIIGKLAAIGEGLTGAALGFVLVAALAVGNGGGRVLAGVLSDKLGRRATMFACFVFQATLILLLSQIKTDTPLASTPWLAVISALIGANYGANLTLFPSITKDYFGLKNFGMNYGLVFTAWGVGGFMLSLGAGELHKIHNTLAIAYYGAAGLLALAAVVTLLVKPPHIEHHASE